MESISSLTQNNAQSNKKLIVRIIGGTQDVNKNLYLYEYDDEIILVDCGIGYPDLDTPGVDVLIPDFTYILDNSHKVKALFITHAHADHIAAVPFLLQEMPDLPIFGSKFVVEMIKRSLSDKNFKHLAQGTRFNLFDPESKPQKFTNFTFRAFPVNHSVPESQAYIIDTPEGKILHVSDYKFDETPVLDKPFDVEMVKKQAEEGVMALLSDCLSVDKPISPPSEATLNETFTTILDKAGNRQVFVTMLSSNVSRMHQLADAAVKHGRKIVASGRTIETVMDIAKTLGYLPMGKEHFVAEEDAHKYDQGTLVYVIAGCYGQPESSLGRLSRDEHKQLSLQKDAIVVFSGEPGPPEINVPVERLTDTLILKGVEVITGDVMDNLHVSGHGGLDNMIKLAKLVHPKYFIPVGGSITKMHHYKVQMGKIGFKEESVFELLEGECVEFHNGVAKKGTPIVEKPVYISASRGEELSPQIIRDRENLSNDGVFVVVIPVDAGNQPIMGKVEVITRGFIYVKENQKLLSKAKDVVNSSVKKNSVKNIEWSKLKNHIEKDIAKFLYKEIGRSPLILVHYLSVS